MRDGSRLEMTPATRRRTFSEDFHGEGLRNETQDGGTDPEVRLLRKGMGKGEEAGLVFMGHALMENRNGLLPDFLVGGATVTAEREAVAALLEHARQRGFHPRTLGGDKGYDTRQCVKAMRDQGVTPHLARRTHSSVDGRTTRHPGYGASRKARQRIGEIFRRMKALGRFRRTRYRGVERTGLAGYFVATAYNMVRVSNPLSCRQARPVQPVWTARGAGRPKSPDGASEPLPVTPLTVRRDLKPTSVSAKQSSGHSIDYAEPALRLFFRSLLTLTTLVGWTAAGRRGIAKRPIELPKPLSEITVAAWVAFKLFTPLVAWQPAMVQKSILNVAIRRLHCGRFIYYRKLLELSLELLAQPLLPSRLPSSVGSIESFSSPAGVDGN